MTRCNSCNCRDFVVNPFQANKCSNCLHNHSAQNTSQFVFKGSYRSRGNPQPEPAPHPAWSNLQPAHPAPLPPSESPRRDSPPVTTDLRSSGNNNHQSNNNTPTNANPFSSLSQSSMPQPPQLNRTPSTNSISQNSSTPNSPVPRPNPLPPMPPRTASGGSPSIPVLETRRPPPPVKKKQPSKFASLITSTGKMVDSVAKAVTSAGSSKKEEEGISVGGIILGSVKHEGHVGFSEKGVEYRNLPPDWQALFTNLDVIIKELGGTALTNKEIEMILTGKLSVTKDESEAEGWKPAGDVQDRMSVTRTNSGLGARKANFSIGRNRTPTVQEASPPVIEETKSYTEDIKVIDEQPEQELLEDELDDLSIEREINAQLRLQLKEQKQATVRAETERMSRQQSDETKLAQLREELEQLKSKMKEKTQKLTELQGQNHSLQTLVEANDKRRVEWSEEKEELAQQLQQAVAARKQAEQRLQSFEQSQEVGLQESFQEKKEFQSKYERLQVQFNEVQQERDTLRSERQQNANDWQTQLQNLNSEHTTHVNELQQRIEQQLQAKQELEEQYQQLEKQKNQWTLQQSQLQQQIDELRSKNNEYQANSSETHQQLYQQINQLQETLQQTQKRATKAEDSANELKELLQQQKQQNETLLAQQQHDSTQLLQSRQEIDRITLVRQQEATIHQQQLDEWQVQKQSLQTANRQLEAELTRLSFTTGNQLEAEQEARLKLEQERQTATQLLQQQISDALLKRDQALEQTNALQLRIAAQTSDYQHLQSQLSDLQANSAKQLEELTNKLAEQRSLVEQRSNQLELAQEKEQKLESERQQLLLDLQREKRQNQQIASLTEELSALKTSFQRDLSEQQTQNNDKVAQLQKQLKENETRANQLEKEKLSLQMELSSSRMAQQNNQQLQEELSQAKSQFEQQKQALTESHKEQIRDLQAKLDSSVASLNDVKTQAANWKAELVQLQETLATEGLTQKNKQDQKLAAIQEELLAAQKQLESQTKTRFELEQASSDLQDECERAQARIVSLETQLEAAKTNCSEFELRSNQLTVEVDSLRVQLKENVSSTHRGTVRASVMPGGPPPPPVAASPPPPPSMNALPSPAPVRGGLFDEIRGGKSLKKVEATEPSKEDLSKHFDDKNVLHILARALIARRQGVEGDKNPVAASGDDDDWA